jgi:hypothetical protein
MRPLKTIRAKCLECSGDSPKEVTLCHQFDCPSWEYRFGYSIKTMRYKRRMEKAKKQFSKEFKELTNMGIDIRNFFVYDKNNS